MAFTKENFLAFLEAASELMNENKQYLCDLDAALGDGDLGLTMSLGFNEALAFAKGSSESDLGKLAAQTGMTMSKKAPSSMGTLVASGFMGAGKAVKGKSELSDEEAAVFFNGFTDGVCNRGKAFVGDRTIVDAIKPASDAFAAAVKVGKSLHEAAALASDAADKGAESTKDLLGKFGRAVYYGDKVLGSPDQGAVAGALIFKALAKSL